MRSDRFTGQVADMVHSGYDSAFSSFIANLSSTRLNFGRNRKDTSNQPAVLVNFVSGSSSKPNIDTKGRKFKLVSPKELLDISLNVQSSNMSLFATSSMPFFDDNVPRNRVYEDPTIVV